MTKPTWVLALSSSLVRRPFVVIVALVLATAGCGSAKSRLPKCPGSFNATTWTNCFGEQIRSDGSKYVGEFMNGLANGQGTKTDKEGYKYVGEFRDGLANGQGATTRPDGGTYVGEFKDDRASGRGTATRPSGHKYVGEFADGVPHGQGTATEPGVGKYVGEFRRGAPHGQGTEFNEEGSVLRSGVWEDGEFKR